MTKRSILILAAVCLIVTKPTAASPIVIAHRGASGYLPEHTLPAKALAHAMGADYIEQDIVLSKDGVPVVLHDIEIDTVTDVALRFPDRARSNGHFYAIDFTLEELKQMRVEERRALGTGQRVYPHRFPAGHSSFHISTLAEELELIQGLNLTTNRQVGIYAEIKSPAWHRQEGQDITTIVLALLAEYGYRTRSDAFYLQCFDFEEVKRIRTELHFEGRLVQLIGRYGSGEIDAAGKSETRDNNSLLDPAHLAGLAEYVDGIGPPFSKLLAKPFPAMPEPNDLVARAHALSLVVHPYTFRTDALPEGIATAEAYLDFVFNRVGVDGLFADQPDVATKFLRDNDP